MEKFFTDKDYELLLRLFRVYAPSKNEDELVEVITAILDEAKVKYIKDEKNNIFSIENKGLPLLSAHMDCVGDKECGSYVRFIDLYNYKNDIILKGFGNIGGDDKCGIFLIMKYILSGKKINFIFSTGEEISSPDGIKQAVESMTKYNKENFDSIPYCIVLDRKHSGDIICLDNDYGTKEFDKSLNDIGEEFNYKTVTGGCSDANTLKAYMNCANLSVGYHNPHSKSEYASMKEMWNSWNFLNKIIDELPRNFKLDPVTKGDVFEVPNTPNAPLPATVDKKDTVDNYDYFD